MFKIEDYYQKVYSGEEVDNSDVLNYIKSFECLIIWGASYQGNAVGKCLLDKGIMIQNYWDARAEEIKELNGIEVILPFRTEPKDNVLVIFCIGNTAIKGGLLRRLKENGYYNVIQGDRLFMGMLCPFNIDIKIDGKVCNGTMTCRSMFCPRLHNIIKVQNDKGGLFLDNLTFMITTRCSLKCKYCVAYMNSYSSENKRHISYEQIAEDIDSIFDNVDAVGAVTIQGGEPFLHPDIDKILKKMLEKKNIGIVSVATNGIFRMDDEQLHSIKSLQDGRLNIAFSGYYDALPEKQMEIFYNNIRLMEENDIPHTVGVKMPEWVIPPSLWNKHYSEKVMREKKTGCRFPERCMQVMDGKLYPCLYSMSLHSIGLADYSQDYIRLKSDRLAERIKRFIDLPFYYSCGHCGGGGGSTGMAGEQGFLDFVNPAPANEKSIDD